PRTPIVLPERAIEQIPDDRHEIQPGDSILLIVEDDPHYGRVLVDLARDKGFKVLVAMRGADALELAKQYQPNAVSLDVCLPDMSGFEVLEELSADEALSEVPVVVFTGRELSAEEDARLHTMARSIVVKGVESPERLLDETALFLHRVVTELPPEKQSMLER